MLQRHPVAPTLQLPASAAWTTGAVHYLQRGPVPVGFDDTTPDISVTDDPATASLQQRTWCFTGCEGTALADSASLRAAVAGRATTALIELREGSAVLARGRVAVRRSVGRTVTHALSVSGPLLEIALAGTQVSEPPTAGPASAVMASLSERAADRRATLAFGKRVARAALTYRQWGIAAVPDLQVTAAGVAPSTGIGPLAWHSPAPHRFWADPGVITDADQTWVFVEELDRSTGRGHIRALQVTATGLVPGQVVLATDHHLSYPIVRRVGDRLVATVETCAGDNPMYTCDRLGDPWQVAADLPALPPHLADAVVAFDDSGQPVEVRGSDARTDADSVYVRHQWDPGAAVWHRDPAATFVDVLTARGGGTWDRERNLRAVQECDDTYGSALAVVPADGWRGPGGALQAIRGDDTVGDWRPAGVHTLTWTPDGSQVWIDGWRRRVSLRGGYRRLVERRHMSRCAG